jgi:KDO2-lipid IV(A) lauroyltransferase
MNISDFFRLPGLTLEDVERDTSITGEDNLADAMAAGNGVLVLVSHLGSWDMLSAGLALRGYPLSLITKVSKSAALNRIWMGYRRQLGMELFMGRGTMKESLKALKKGCMVGFALDQNARRSEGVFVPFFGRKACTITSLALMARRTGVPVLPIYIYREGDMHRIVIDEPVIHDNIEDAQTDIFERTRAYAGWTEKVIREHPEQWTWLHDRWKTRPRND